MLFFLSLICVVIAYVYTYIYHFFVYLIHTPYIVQQQPLPCTHRFMRIAQLRSTVTLFFKVVFVIVAVAVAVAVGVTVLFNFNLSNKFYCVIAAIN